MGGQEGKGAEVGSVDDVDGDAVTLAEGGDVLACGCLVSRALWLDASAR